MTAGAWPGHDGADSRAIDPGALRVAAVLDEPTAAGLAPECELIEVASDTWRAVLEERAPDLLLVESAWAGTSGSWQYQVAAYDHPDSRGLPELRSLVEWCRRRDLPTVFWSHSRAHEAHRFTEAASLFEHVFTSRPEGLDAEPLPIAVQPRIHNPLSPPDPPAEAPCYLGPYRRDRPAEDLRALEALLDAALDRDLAIYDPDAGSSGASSELPERFRPNVKGRLPYRRTGDAYKSHRVALVAGEGRSSSALPRGALEAAACGTAFLSGPSAGLGETFGELAPIAGGREDAAGALARLLDRGDRGERVTAAAQRLTLTEHTYRRRLQAIARAVGHPVPAAAGREVAALVLVDGLAELGRLGWLAEALAEQSLPPAEVLVGHAPEDALEGELGPLSGGDGRVRVRAVRQDPGVARAERYRELATIASSPWVAPMNVTASYGRHHLTDLVVRAEFARAEAIGTEIGPDGSVAAEADRYARAVHPHSALVRREVVAVAGWPDDVGAALEGARAAFERGLRCYGAAGGSFRAGRPDAAGSLQPPRAA